MDIKKKFINFMAQLSEDNEEVKPVDTTAADEAPIKNQPEEGEVEKNMEIGQRVSDLEIAVAEIKATIENFIAKQEAEEEDSKEEEQSEEEQSEEEQSEEEQSEEEQSEEKEDEEEEDEEEQSEEKEDEEKEELKRKCEQLSAQLSAMESELKELKALPSAKQDIKRTKWF